MQQNNGKRSGGRRFGDFLAGKGFYIVLFLCVAAIGISGYFLLTDSAKQQSRPVAATAPVVVTPTPGATLAPSASPAHTATSTSTPQPSASVRPSPSAQPSATPAPSAAPSPTPAPQAAPTVLTWPVKGEVVGAFSVEALAYDATLGDWRTHAGMDIAAALGTQVLAAADGTVKNVVYDELMGETVVIAHEGGMETLYANLAGKPTVQVGDSVTTGAVIGAVGNTAVAETGVGNHLHFELTQDGDPVDPALYLAKR